MENVTVGVLTISDRCSDHPELDESGPNLIRIIENGLLKNAIVTKISIVPDEEILISNKLKEWCDIDKVNLILTTGGTGIAPRDVTPEATRPILHKEIPGISNLILQESLKLTQLSSLSRGVAGVRGESLIINLPGSKKASQECLEFVAGVIPHAVDLIRDLKRNIEGVHSSLQNLKSKVKSGNPAGRERKSSYLCVEVPTAQQAILERVLIFKKRKKVSLDKSLGFILSNNAHANDYLPPFDASLKDGYAVCSSDKSLIKKVLGTCVAGSYSNTPVSDGNCIRINTGAAIPPGADAVVPVEESCLLSLDTSTNEEGSIKLQKLALPGQEIRPKGSDYKRGDVLLEEGTYISSSAIGVLAAAGIISVDIYEKPKVSVFSTGDELVDPFEKSQPGKVRDSNRITLINLLKEEGFEAFDLGISRDSPDTLFSTLYKGFTISDVVVTTGSMSMGEKDYLKNVLITDFEAEIIFGRVFMKPGKPTAFAVLTFEGKSKFWFGLPGNPASAVVTSHLFLLPALRKMSGYKDVFPPSVNVTLNFDILLEDRPHYHRAVAKLSDDGTYKVSTTGSQSSSRIGSCVNANCLLKLPVGSSKMPSGTLVSALLIGK